MHATLIFLAVYRLYTAPPGQPISTSPGALESPYRLVFVRQILAPAARLAAHTAGVKTRCFSRIFRDAIVRRVKAARRRRPAALGHLVWRADRCATKLGPVAFWGRADGPDVFGLESAPARADGRREASWDSAPSHSYLCESLIARGLPCGRLGRRRASDGRVSPRKICGPTTRRRGCACHFLGDIEVRTGCARVFLRRRPGLGRLRRARISVQSETPVQNRTRPQSTGPPWPQISPLVLA